MKSEPSILKRISVASKIDLTQNDKSELWNKVESRIESVPTRKRVSLKVVLATSVPVVALGLTGYTFVYNGQMIFGKPAPMPPHLTQAQKQAQISHQPPIESITTPFGEYIRTKEFVNLTSNQIAYSKAAALKPGIKEIVLSYGIFIKNGH